MSRHPFAAVGCDFAARGGLASSVRETNIFNITYIVPQNNCGEHRNAELSDRRLFYDLGCSVYEDGTPIDGLSGSGFGPSLPLFDQMYAGQCLELSHLYGWEMRVMEPTQWWANVTAEMRARLTFYNIPIEEDYHSEGSFSKHLLASASASDFVAVKVDIDHVPVELPIVRGIARRPELSALVDEVFFEYHFDFDGLDFGWRSQPGGVNHVNDTVDDALALMSELRRAGVRSHYWI